MIDLTKIINLTRKIGRKFRIFITNEVSGYFINRFNKSKKIDPTGLKIVIKREIEPGYPPTKIDWIETILHDFPYIALKTALRSPNIYIMVDISKSSFFGFGKDEYPKLNLTLNLAYALAILLIRQSCQVGFIFFTDKIEYFHRPVSSLESLRKIFYEIERKTKANVINRKTDLKAAVDLLFNLRNKIFSKPDFIFLISDLIFDERENLLEKIKRHFDFFIVVVREKQEISLPKFFLGLGVLVIEDLENGKKILAKGINNDIEEVKMLLKKIKVDYCISKDLEGTLMEIKRIFDRKNRRIL